MPDEYLQTAYGIFLELSPEEKDAFINSFGSMEAFYEWLVPAQAEYKNRQSETIEIGSGSALDLSKLNK